MTSIIIIICSMLLLAYLGEINSDRTGIPNVILLLFLGWLARQMAGLFKWNVPDLLPLLPFLGTIGLILIVLEGSLELSLSKSRYAVIRRSFVAALLPMAFLSLFFGFIFSLYAGIPLYTGFINALPLSVIRSSIAIPTTKNISPELS